jgi:hypothetical protein
MAEILNDLKLSALKLSSTSNAAPQPTYSDGLVTFSGSHPVDTSHSGRMHFGASGGTNPAIVTLPAITNLSLGDRFTFVQNTTPAAEVLIITTSGSDTFGAGSYVCADMSNVGGTSAFELVQPGNVTCTSLLVRNAGTNATHGIGSTLDCQVVAKNRWLLVGNSKPLGSGHETASGSTGAYQWSASTVV